MQEEIKTKVLSSLLVPLTKDQTIKAILISQFLVADNKVSSQDLIMAQVDENYYQQMNQT